MGSRREVGAMMFRYLGTPVDMAPDVAPGTAGSQPIGIWGRAMLGIEGSIGPDNLFAEGGLPGR